MGRRAAYRFSARDLAPTLQYGCGSTHSLALAQTQTHPAGTISRSRVLCLEQGLNFVFTIPRAKRYQQSPSHQRLGVVNTAVHVFSSLRSGCEGASYEGCTASEQTKKR